MGASWTPPDPLQPRIELGLSIIGALATGLLATCARCAQCGQSSRGTLELGTLPAKLQEGKMLETVV